MTDRRAFSRFAVPSRMATVKLCVLSLPLAAAACGPEQDVLVGRNLGDEDAQADGSAWPTDVSSVPSDAPLTPGEFCLGSGPVELPMVGGCTADIAKQAFRFALCSCSDLVYSGVITTDSFSSDTGEDLVAGGAVGVNGRYVASTRGTTIAGSLWSQGDATFGGHEVAGELRTGGNLQGLGEVRVRRNAYLVGNAAGSGVTIDGQLSAAPESSIEGLTATGGIVRETVNVPPPCNCARPLDIPGIVAHLSTQNDNVTHGVSADEMASLTTPTERVLRCGRYFFRGIDIGTNSLTLRIYGRTAIAVQGRVRSEGGALRIQLEEGSELDLFVSADIDLNGPVDIGDRARPAAMRIYGGAGFTYSGEAQLAANLYLPAARLVAATRMEIWGSVFAEGFELSGILAAHYDQAILDVKGCTPNERQCQSCGECANPTPACRAGHCGACTADEECCPPLRCEAGRCVADVVIH